jgi:L-lactate utilization protein LutC
MRLSDELEFIRALPEEGALVVTADRDERGRLRAAIEQACGHEAAKRVCITLASREDQIQVVRSGAYRGALCWPPITAAMIAEIKDAEKMALLTTGRRPATILDTLARAT